MDSNSIRSSINAEQDGSYCFELPKGSYVVEPSIMYRSKKFNVLPRQRKIVLDSGPVLGVDFSREKLSVKGRVELIPGILPSTVKDLRIVLKNMK